ncbi:unnamed protein product [Brassicogethes aeneus]|uniref:cAMP-regulated phosphoprotein 21 n=1 Tax=Brassicogethes aeneus TaxID=1431903 RepID=A0A9P0AY50_BRAAE|nr:unnamed protein product [Brassicogethes aeneus]
MQYYRCRAVQSSSFKMTKFNNYFLLQYKSKFLVRSHAMREEQSPPREPSPHRLVSPAIKLTPSPEPAAEASTCLSGGASPSSNAGCTSPTSTLVPSPNSRCSPHSASSGHIGRSCEVYSDGESPCSPCSPKYLDKINCQNVEKEHKQSSHVNSNRKKLICDCPNQNCIKCSGQDKTLNNNNSNINNNVISPNTLTVVKSTSRGKLRQQSSSQGSFEGSSTNSPCLSRDSSSEYTDTTGVDLEIFIPETLNRNAKDRALMLRIEQELVTLAKDRNFSQSYYKFPPMSSYQRMLVHRCAAYFGMDHNIESSGKCVVVNKTRVTRIPDVPFKEHIKPEIVFAEEPRRSILKRDSNSIEDYGFKSPDRSFSLENRRSKSFEEREEEYEKVRRRIFNRELLEGSDYDWPEIPWSSSESDFSGKYRLQPPESHHRHFGKLIKVQSEDTGETLRPCVAKSYSFGGYGGVLSRGDSIMSTHSAGPRLLTKQDSGCSSVSWRLSPSSSGYKSQSQMSESVTPSPTSTPHPVDASRQDSALTDDESARIPEQLVWAVTDIHNVPKGSVIINPQTGKPVKNHDGSIYHYDPQNPPGYMTTNKPPPSPQKILSKETNTSPKRRSAKTSPVRTKSNVTTTATSPSLPYVSPAGTPQQIKSFQFVQQSQDPVPSVQQPPPPQQFSQVFNNGFPASQENVAVYQSPQQAFLMYATTPYSIPMPAQQFDGRIIQEGTQIAEIPSSYYVADGVAPPQTQLTYQQQPSSYWNQQPIAYYHNNPQNSANQRFAVPIPQTQTGYIPQAYQPNYLPQQQQACQAADMLPLYPPPNQLPVVYQQASQAATAATTQPANAAAAAMIYGGQQVMYNPMYQAAPNSVYQTAQTHQPPYPTTPTPNSCASSISNAQQQQYSTRDQNFVHLAQGMQQMSIGSGLQGGSVKNPPPQSSFQYDRPKSFSNGNKFGSPKGFVMVSSQSSTGTNSPATTVISGYCPNSGVEGAFRTPPDTPLQYGYRPTTFYPPPQMFRQISNVRTPTPGTNWSSRSPTPASDYERQRMSLPPNLINQKMPYVLQSSGKSQTTLYRQQHYLNNKQHSFSQGTETRSYRGRRPK